MEEVNAFNDAEEENIRVVVRIRPMQLVEKKDNDFSCVESISNGKAVQVRVGPLDAQVYRCDSCFPPSSTTQLNFFNECGITNLLDSTLNGYRACAFAFGQTGAGKTFTMTGPTKGFSSRDKQMGIVGRSIEYLLNRIDDMKSQRPDVDPNAFSMKISCLEIYQE